MDVAYINNSDSSPKYGGVNGSRQLTPPDSPLPSIHGLLGTIETGTRKMALDFIAPSNDSSNDRPTLSGRGLDCLSAAAALHRGSRPTTPLELPTPASHYSPPVSRDSHMDTPYNTPDSYDYRPVHNLPSPPEHHDYRASSSSNLPSPVWSSSSDSSDSQLYRPDPPFGRSMRHCRTSTPILRPQELITGREVYLPMTYIPEPYHLPPYTGPLIPVNRPQKRSTQHHAENKLYTSLGSSSSNHPVRDERYPYDNEERYAIIHLRGLKTLRYIDVVARFNILFPPQTPRRCRKSGLDKGLPKDYPQRNIQGIQCRWYRIVDEANLPKLRSSGVGSNRSKVEDVLSMLEREGDLSDGFVGYVNYIADLSNEKLPRQTRMSM